MLKQYRTKSKTCPLNTYPVNSIRIITNTKTSSNTNTNSTVKIMSDNISHYDEQYSTTQLLIRPFDDQLKFDENGKIKDGFKWEINNSTYNIQNSKLIGKPDDKFETVLFSPETEGCKGEGGLRTKGYFKFSYKKLMFNNKYLILNDKEGNKFKVDNSNSTLNIQR